MANTARIDTFRNEVFPYGLDLKRCSIRHDEGIYKTPAAATFEQGQFLTLVAGAGSDVDQLVQAATGTDVLGVAKRNKTTFGSTVVVDEAVTVADGGVITLLKGGSSGGCVAASLVMRSAADMGGVVIPALNNFTYNAGAGTVTFANPPAGVNAPIAGGIVYVTYSVNLTSADRDIDGWNYRMSMDDVTRSQDRVAVITGWARLFSTQFETGSATSYSLTGAGSNLYCSAAAKATNTAGTQYVGKVFQLPTATDRYMGMTLHGDPVAA